MNLKGYVFRSDGTPVNGATVNYYSAIEGTPTTSLGTTSTNANGMWTFSGVTNGAYDVKIEYSGEVRWIKGLSTFQSAEFYVTTGATLKRRVYLPASSFGSPATSGAADGAVSGTNVSYRTKDFDPATAEHADIELAFPSEYDGGNISVTFWWTAASGTGAVVWQLKVSSGGDNTTIDAPLTTVVTATDTLLTANNRHLVSATWSSSLPGAGHMVQLRVSRDAANASDTLGVDARLLGVSLDFGVV